jgi:3-methyladenine DNA glycosylase/8-oxoguanine DNA glycosylase
MSHKDMLVEANEENERLKKALREAKKAQHRKDSDIEKAIGLITDLEKKYSDLEKYVEKVNKLNNE